MPRKDQQMLTLSQAAEIANRDSSTLRRAIDRGVLKADKVGAYWIVTKDELERWMKSPAYDSSKQKRS